MNREEALKLRPQLEAAIAQRDAGQRDMDTKQLAFGPRSA